MYITQQTDYAFRVLIYTAIHSDGLVQIGTIAETYRISKNHLMKVASDLVKGGFLIGVRGKGGGLKLAKSSDEIIIGDIVRHMENLKVIDCLDDKCSCAIHGSCRLGGIFHQAVQMFLNHLDKYSLSDLIAQPADFSQL